MTGRCSSGKQHQEESFCKATVIGQETRARGRVCQMETFVTMSIRIEAGAPDCYRDGLWGSRACTPHAWRHSKSWERRTLLDSWECISTPWNCKWAPMQPLESVAGRDWIETSGPRVLVAAVSCARKAGQLEESTVREHHGRSRDEGAREGSSRSTLEEFGMRTIRLVESRTHC